MLKTTLLVWCLLLAASSYNAQNAIQSADQENFPFSPFVQPIHQDQYYGSDNEDNEDYRENNPTDTIPSQQSTSDRLGKLTWPSLSRHRPVANKPSKGVNLSEPVVAENKQVFVVIRVIVQVLTNITRIFNVIRTWYRTIFSLWGLLFSDSTSLATEYTTTTITHTDTITDTTSCTISTTACAQNRRRRSAIKLTTIYTTDRQLEKELSSLIILV